MEVYVDDVLIKSTKDDQHFCNLEEAFAMLRPQQMKLNLSKYIFCVTSKKFLSFMIMKCIIKADLKKIQAILQMRHPTLRKEVQHLIGCIAAFNWFILKSMEKCLSFFKILQQMKDFT